MPEGMHPLEIGSFATSVLALCVSIAAPFLVYRLLVNEVRVHQLKAAGLRATISRAMSCSFEGENEVVYASLLPEVCNEGSLPVCEVQLILEFRGREDSYFADVEVSLEPPLDFTKTISGKKMSISLDGAIAPGQQVTFEIQKGPFTRKIGEDREGGFSDLSGWIRSEATPAIPLMDLPVKSYF